ncbi:MAG: DNA methyltransferase [Deltaproteobacteria bacterium]|nr:DNA methyltransferase [Deltaproteobacteria bacterium]
MYPGDMGQVQAFEDIWVWGPHCDSALEEAGPGMDMLRALVDGMGKIQMAAYLVMMTPRLAALHSILKPTGSMYLHCDPTASHYLKVILDNIFGHRHQQHRKEVIWKRTSSHNDSRTMGAVHDVLLYYPKGRTFTFNPQYGPYDPDYIESHYRHQDEDGRLWQDGDLTAKGLSGGGYEYAYKGKHSLWRVPPHRMAELDAQGRLYFTRTGGIRFKRYLDEGKGQPISDVWTDIPPVNSQAREQLPYQTQKPLDLLNRIVRQSSNPGDVILDPFCGCGSSVAAAENLNRGWIGIDITYAAIAAIRERFRRERVDIWQDVEIVNKPETMQDVDRLLQPESPLHPRKEFEKFCVASIGGLPNEKMGADGGVDGRIPLREQKRANVSVKSGNVTVRDMRDLKGTLDRKNVSGVFITRQSPTRPMRELASTSGIVQLEAGLIPPFPRMQILTLDEILNGKRPELPYAEAA